MKLIVRKTGTIFDFCESSNGTDYDGQIYGGSSVKLSYTNDTLKVIVDGGEANSYPLADLNYDDGSEIIGFATMLEFIEAVKGAGFTGNFNTGGATPQYTTTEQEIGTLNGAPLFRKCFFSEDTSTFISISHGLDSINYLVKGQISCVVDSHSFGVFDINNSSVILGETSLNQTDIYIDNANLFPLSNILIILEYTKLPA